MEIIRWKVLFSRPGGILASIACGGLAEVNYEIGVWSIAPNILSEQGYHLTVFQNLKAAKAFQQTVAPREPIFECLCEEKIFPLPPYGNVFLIDKGVIEPSKNGNWPMGTEMYKRVKPIKVL